MTLPFLPTSVDCPNEEHVIQISSLSFPKEKLRKETEEEKLVVLVIVRGGRYIESFWQPCFLPNGRSQTKNEAKISNFENVGRFWGSVHCLWGLVAFLLLHNIVQVGVFVSCHHKCWPKSNEKEFKCSMASSFLYFVFEIFKLPYKNSFIFENLNCNYGYVLDVLNVIHRFDQSSWWDSAFSFRALYNCLCGLDYIYSWESVLFPCVLCGILVILVFNFWNDSGYWGRQFWLWVGALIIRDW